MLNKVILIGNTGQEPESKTLESGAKIAKISLATSENWKDKNDEWQSETEWHNVVGWNNAASAIERLQKGDKVYIEGKIKTRKYDTPDGQTKYITEIVAHTIRRINKRENDQSSESTITNYPKPAQATSIQPQPDDDLPF